MIYVGKVCGEMKEKGLYTIAKIQLWAGHGGCSPGFVNQYDQINESQ